MDNRRLLIAALLSVAVLFAWQLLFPPPEPPRRAAPAAPLAVAPEATAAASSSPESLPATAPSALPSAAPLPPLGESSERRLVLENAHLRAEFTNRGAQLLSVQLKEKVTEDGKPVELVQRRGKSPHPFALLAKDGTALPVNNALFAVEASDSPESSEPGELVFRFRGQEGGAEKRFQLLADGRIGFTLRMEGGFAGGGVLLGPGIGVRTAKALDDRMQGRAAVWRSAGAVEVAEARGADELLRLSAAALDWVGLEDTYFLAAVLPESGLAEARLEPVVLTPADGESDRFDGAPFGAEEALSADQKRLPRDLRLVLVPSGDELTGTSFWGAKQFDRLAELGRGLQETVRLGWLSFLAKPLLRALQWIHAHLTPNYGWAIVLLTAALKIVLLPLSLAAFKSMRKMQKLNPKMQAIRERYRPKLRDKQGRFNPDMQRQMNEEVMGLYRAEGVNPAGGCLPILVQLPIFFAFYQLLSTAVELWQSPWILWVRNLTAPDPYFVLPIVMGLTQIVQQRMTPPPPDPMQKRMLQILPIVFTVFSLGFPSGLVLYWLTNNVLSIAQQGLYNRIQERAEHPAEVVAPRGKRGKR